MKKSLFWKLGFLIFTILFCFTQTQGVVGKSLLSEDEEDPSGSGETANDLAVGAVSSAPELINPDTYVVAGYGMPTTLDPAWTYETLGEAIETNIYEGLVWYNKDKTDEFVPLLATNWNSNQSGSEWTFNIREGVTFHAGGTLEPHDIAYSLQRALMQDRFNGPHWMTHEAFFGTFSMEETLNLANGTNNVTVSSANSTQLQNACNYVKSAIVADDQAGTVTYTLAKSNSLVSCNAEQSLYWCSIRSGMDGSQW